MATHSRILGPRKLMYVAGVRDAVDSADDDGERCARRGDPTRTLVENDSSATKRYAGRVLPIATVGPLLLLAKGKKRAKRTFKVRQGAWIESA